MLDTKTNSPRPCALITGAAKRIGRGIAQALHSEGVNVIIHCQHSLSLAEDLAGQLNQQRDHSACVLTADLSKTQAIETLAKNSLAVWGRLDVLVNNASVFTPLTLAQVDEQAWEQILAVNLKAPFLLAQALASALKETQGCIINISDIHAQRPLKNYPVYSVSKAGLDMLSKALARELAPQVRCNGVAPGAIVWPTEQQDQDQQQAIIDKTALKRQGRIEDIAQAVLFLIRARYITGQIISVDGGRTLSH